MVAGGPAGGWLLIRRRLIARPSQPLPSQLRARGWPRGSARYCPAKLRRWTGKRSRPCPSSFETGPPRRPKTPCSRASGSVRRSGGSSAASLSFSPLSSARSSSSSWRSPTARASPCATSSGARSRPSRCSRRSAAYTGSTTRACCCRRAPFCGWGHCASTRRCVPRASCSFTTRRGSSPTNTSSSSRTSGSPLARPTRSECSTE
mmetsp:Transcript_45445/g.146430  ORF Transcript_45445/g.146430 Transcript_45445/m.146430 type:complete len:205 (+) Transcript_45445:86-700(+)